MQQADKENTSILGFTFIETRSGARWPCPELPPIDVLARPHFGSIPARVRDISRHGMGLNCLKPIKPGTELLLRVEPHGCLVKAKVVHATLDLDGWQVGCVFAEPLTDDEVAAYVAVDF